MTRVQKITVGVDGSAASREALRWAADLASRVGAELDVVRAWHYPPPLDEWNAVPTNYGYLPQLPEEGQVEIAMREDLDRIVTEVLGADPAVARSARLVRGHAADAMLAQTDDAELLLSLIHI